MTDKINYIDEIAGAIAETAGDTFDSYAGIELYRQYALLFLSKGGSITGKDIHDAWSVWACEHRPQSANIIPYDQLSDEYKAQDEPYVAAIRRLVDWVEIDRHFHNAPA